MLTWRGGQGDRLVTFAVVLYISLYLILYAAPQHLLPENIPYNLIQFGPAFPNMGGLILEFPSLELAMRISAALEQSTSSPKIIMLPTIHVRTIFTVSHAHTHTYTILRLKQSCTMYTLHVYSPWLLLYLHDVSYM